MVLCCSTVTVAVPATTDPPGDSIRVVSMSAIRPQSLLSGTKRMRLTPRAFVCCAIALSAAPVHAPKVSGVREVAGVSLPDVVVVAGEKLRLNGMGLLKKFIFFKGYVVGFYLKEPTTDGRTAIMNDETKRVVIDMRRDVSRRDFVKAVETSFTPNVGAGMPDLRARL